MNIITKKMNLPDGREITIQTGKLAKQSDGAVEIRIGDTVLLATAVAAKNAKPGVDFMPLTIDYREKYAAAGKFPGGFFKREARPSEYEILTMRLVDRALRPLFPEDFHADTQVMIQLLSADENMADSLACFAASAALACSDIPFETPVSEVRISRVDGEFVINPTYEQNAKADMDMVIAGTKDSIMMVEGEMKEISEAEMVDAIKTAHVVIKEQCAIIRNIYTDDFFELSTSHTQYISFITGFIMSSMFFKKVFYYSTFTIFTILTGLTVWSRIVVGCEDFLDSGYNLIFGLFRGIIYYIIVKDYYEPDDVTPDDNWVEKILRKYLPKGDEDDELN